MTAAKGAPRRHLARPQGAEATRLPPPSRVKSKGFPTGTIRGNERRVTQWGPDTRAAPREKPRSPTPSDRPSPPPGATNVDARGSRERRSGRRGSAGPRHRAGRTDGGGGRRHGDVGVTARPGDIIISSGGPAPSVSRPQAQPGQLSLWSHGKQDGEDGSDHDPHLFTSLDGPHISPSGQQAAWSDPAGTTRGGGGGGDGPGRNVSPGDRAKANTAGRLGRRRRRGPSGGEEGQGVAGERGITGARADVRGRWGPC
ncbi:unnamed protein product [Lampetra fluviatilis]